MTASGWLEARSTRRCARSARELRAFVQDRMLDAKRAEYVTATPRCTAGGSPSKAAGWCGGLRSIPSRTRLFCRRGTAFGVLVSSGQITTQANVSG